MFAYGTDKPSVLQRAGSEGFEAFCQLIAGLPCTSPYDAAQLLSYYIEDRHPGTVAAVLTGRADDPLLSAVDHARAEGVQVSVFYLERKAAPSDEAALEALEREGVPVVRFSVQERLHTALDGRRI